MGDGPGEIPLTYATRAERIDELRSFVAHALPVNEARYPSLSPDDNAVAFCVKHSALHFSKTSGQLAALAEKLDHGAEADLEEATKIVANSLVNALKLAEELSISTSSILAFLEEKYR